MAEQFDSPVDVVARDAGVPGLTHMVMAVGVALSTVTMLNAHALATWADGLAPGTRSASVATVAHRLADQTKARGLDRPRATLKASWDQAKAARWRGPSEDQR